MTVERALDNSLSQFVEFLNARQHPLAVSKGSSRT